MNSKYKIFLALVNMKMWLIMKLQVLKRIVGVEVILIKKENVLKKLFTIEHFMASDHSLYRLLMESIIAVKKIQQIFLD